MDSNGVSRQVAVLQLRAGPGGYIFVAIVSVVLITLIVYAMLTSVNTGAGWSVICFIIFPAIITFLALWRLQLSVNRDGIRYRSLIRHVDCSFASIDRIEFRAPKKSGGGGAPTVRVLTMIIHAKSRSAKPIEIPVKPFGKPHLAKLVRVLQRVDASVSVGAAFADRVLK